MERIISRIIDANVNKVTFFAPQICDILKDVNFDTILKRKEKATWEVFKGMVLGFLANERDNNFSSSKYSSKNTKLCVAICF